MKGSRTLIGRFTLTLGFILIASAGTATAATVNLQVSGTVPLESSANDFHIRVAIADEFLLGEPINLVNGPFASDGVVSSTDTGFTVEVKGRLLALFLLDGKPCAIDDSCPHMGASLGDGSVHDGIVMCPWHAWRFRLSDGVWADAPKSGQKVNCYAAKVEEGKVLVEVDW